jgi:hypothetical protein
MAHASEIGCDHEISGIDFKRESRLLKGQA